MLGIRLFSIVSVAIVAIVLLVYFLHPISNIVGDLGYYLKMGEIILATHSVPSTNYLSYTNPDFPFINANWLSEVVFYICFKLLGGNGLIVLGVFLSLASFLLLVKKVIGKYNMLSILIVSLLYVQIVYERTDIKPELFSYLLLSIFIYVLYGYKTTKSKIVYLLVPAQLLWTNLHIFFFLGPVVILMFLLDELIHNKFKIKKSKALIAIFLISSFAILINPNFIKGALYPLFVMQNYGFKVEENSGFLTAINSYQDTTFLFFEISIALLWVGILFTWNKLKPIDIALSILFTFFGLFAVRMFPLFAIGTFIPLVKVASAIIEYFEIKRKFKKPTILKLEIGIFIVLIILLIPSFRQNIDIHGFGFGIVDNAKESLQFVKSNNIQGPIYNNYDIGNYLDFGLYPHEKVFVDGRPEAYPKSFFEEVYFPMQNSQKVFDKFDQKYNFNVAIIAHTDTSPSGKSLLNNLIKSPNWKMVYLNNTIVIFLKNSDKNQHLIKRFLINQNNLSLSHKDLSSRNNVRQLVNFFGTVGWEKPWLSMNLRYLDFEPKNCAALQNVTFIYQKQNNQQAPIYTSRFLDTCN